MPGAAQLTQRTNSAKVTVDQVAYWTVADRIWRIPPHGGQTPVNLTLHITNLRRASLALHTYQQPKIDLTSQEGKSLKFVLGATPPFFPPSSPTLPAGSTFALARSASLTWHGQVLRLSGSAGYGSVWFIDGLRLGRYTLQLDCQTQSASVQTPPITIEVR